MQTFTFIDASNLFYGGEKSLGWRIDYKKLFQYLHTKYEVGKVFYFGGVEIHDFKYDYQQSETIPIKKLEQHLKNKLQNKESELDEAELLLLSRHWKRVKFFKRLETIGYRLVLKPVKLYYQENGTTKRKANCDVDMAFYLLKEKENFNRAVILSGDGDFLPVLKYMKEIGKEIIILSRGNRTAKEIRQFAGNNFRDFEYLKNILRMVK